MDSQYWFKGVKLQSVSEAEANIISHGSSDACDRVCGGAIRSRNRDAFKLDSACGAIGEGYGGGDT
tara:strand:- start:2800 stop:2997 length:198 start_codon:yes stop_codon:yes gene_type:complete